MLDLYHLKCLVSSLVHEKRLREYLPNFSVKGLLLEKKCLSTHVLNNDLHLFVVLFLRLITVVVTYGRHVSGVSTDGKT